MRKSKPTKKLKPTAHKLGHHPDLRTKAGRAWKAREAEKLARRDARALARKEAFVNSALKISGSWLSKAEMDAKLWEASASIALDKGEGQMHYTGDPCPGGHLHDGAVNGLSQEDTEKVRQSKEVLRRGLITSTVREALASIALDKGEEGSTHYEGDACPGGHRAAISPEDFEKLKVTGMAWELYPDGPSRGPSAPGAYSKVGV